MHKQAVTKISRGNWFLVIFLGMAGQIAWNVNNVWFNTFMYSKITPDPRAIALLVGVSAVIATLTTLVMGTAGDRLGKRKPFIICGYLCWGITIIVFPLSANIGVTTTAVAAAVTLAAVMPLFYPHASPFPGRRHNGAFVVDTFNRDQARQEEGCPAAEERLE